MPFSQHYIVNQRNHKTRVMLAHVLTHTLCFYSEKGGLPPFVPPICVFVTVIQARGYVAAKFMLRISAVSLSEGNYLFPFCPLGTFLKSEFQTSMLNLIHEGRRTDNAQSAIWNFASLLRHKRLWITKWVANWRDVGGIPINGSLPPPKRNFLCTHSGERRPVSL